MARFLLCFIIAGGVLTACRSSGENLAETIGWRPSTLSEETRKKIEAGLKAYQQCINDETRIHLDDRMDSRRVTDLILRNCEDELSAIKPIFDAEQVPAAQSERYLRSKRSHAAQQILRVVMATQAVRSPSDSR